jgi:hypothetical protein
VRLVETEGKYWGTIGSKLVKYLLREIQVGHVPPDRFPLSVVWPLSDEYHLSEAVTILSARVDRALVPLTMGLLLQRGRDLRNRLWRDHRATAMMLGPAWPPETRPDFLSSCPRF